MSKTSDFVHLHVHTDYSLLDGACRIDRLCQKTKELGMNAVALTDHGNLFGAIDFFQVAHKHDLKPLVGCEVYLAYDHKQTDKPERSQLKTNHMGLLAQNFQGYQNLIKLVSGAHLNGFYYKPRTDMEQLAAHSQGLIGFSGCLQGVIPQFLLHGEFDKAREALIKFLDIFTPERYFIEIQNHGLDMQIKIIPGLLKLAQEFNLKVVCTNDVHYVNNDDWAPHDALLCIQTGAKLADERRMRYSSQQFYLKSPDEMGQLFNEYPDSLKNTAAVAEMVDLKLPFGENHYPVFTIAPEIKPKFASNFEYFKHLCIEGLKERYNFDYNNPDSFQPHGEHTEDLKTVLPERLDYELSIIEKTGFIDYFLIVWDFIDWARKESIPVGPGRGSGAGCLVAYALKITDIDPIRFKLLFERFLNPERVSPPDFDIDFCMRRRADVIQYVRDKYGKDAVANIITFGTFGAKMIVRDLARVNDVPYAEADRIAKMIPDDIGITLDQSLEKSSELKAETKINPIAKEIITHGRVIEGMVRNTGTHAAGVIIADRPLTEFIPVTLQEGALTTQYPKDPVEQLGLLKMDFLGLKTLTIIADAQDNVRNCHNLPDFDIEKQDFNDSKTFELLNSAKTVGVFQLESGGMQALCRQFSISNIDEIVALIALYRPGPMDWIPDYIKGKQDPSTIKFPHPLLEDICKETYGVMVYQEQVMEAAKVIAGYSLGGADILRRAMGKKKVEEMEKQRSIFIEGAKTHNNIPKDKATEIFKILEKFAGYGFNKSHSAAYAILAYRTAYLKANYPIEFMAAVLSAELGNADKVAHFIEECSAMEIPVLGPNINISNESFTPILSDNKESGSIRFGLAAIKGVGDSASIKIIEEREENGPFTDFVDFVHRVDSRTVNKRVLECLIKTGAFDDFNNDRQHLLDSMEAIMNDATASQKDRDAGQASLFDLMDASDSSDDSFSGKSQVMTSGPCMTQSEKLKNEKALLGFYISGHPMNDYAIFEQDINSLKPDEIQDKEDHTPFQIAGVASNLVKRFSKKDKRPWVAFTLATRKHNFSLNVFPDAYETYGKYLEEGEILYIKGTIRNRNGDFSLNIGEIQPLDSRLPSLIEHIKWTIQADHPQTDEFLTKLNDYMLRNEGMTKTRLLLKTADGKTIMTQLAQSLACNVKPEALLELRAHEAVQDLRFDTNFSTEIEPPTYRRKRKVLD